MSEFDTEKATALLKAMQLERDGHAFYLAAAHQTESAAGKNMFLSLARDELQHLQLLDGVYRSWVESGNWPAVPAVEKAATRHWPIFPPPDQAAKVVPARSNELGALRQGIQAEEASIALYQQALDDSADPTAAGFFEFLVRQEEGHRTILQGEYDHLTHTGFWFDLREFDLEGVD